MKKRSAFVLTARFKVYRNPRPRRRNIPFLLEVQSDLVDTGSRVGAPLIHETRCGVRVAQLHPVFVIKSVRVVAAVSDRAATAARDLRDPVADLGAEHAVIMRAIDFLLSGY